MPVTISDAEYQQLLRARQPAGGGEPTVTNAYAPAQAPGAPGLGAAYRQAVTRTQELVGDQVEYDPATNTLRPRGGAPLNANSLRRVAAAWQTSTTGKAGEPAPMVTAPGAPGGYRPTGGGLVGRDAGTGYMPGFGWGTEGPPVKLGANGQQEDWHKFVTPERAAFLERLKASAGPGATFIPSYDASGGYWRPASGTGDLGGDWQAKIGAADQPQAPPMAPPIVQPTPPLVQPVAQSTPTIPTPTGPPVGGNEAREQMRRTMAQNVPTLVPPAQPPTPAAPPAWQVHAAQVGQQQAPAASNFVAMSTAAPSLVPPQAQAHAPMQMPAAFAAPVFAQPTPTPTLSRRTTDSPLSLSPTSTQMLTSAITPDQLSLVPTAPEQFAASVPGVISGRRRSVLDTAAPWSPMSGAGGVPLNPGTLAALNARRMA